MTKALRIWLAGPKPDARGHWDKYKRANGIEMPPKPQPTTASDETAKQEKDDE